MLVIKQRVIETWLLRGIICHCWWSWFSLITGTIVAHYTIWMFLYNIEEHILESNCCVNTTMCYQRNIYSQVQQINSLVSICSGGLIHMFWFLVKCKFYWRVNSEFLQGKDFVYFIKLSFFSKNKNSLIYVNLILYCSDF